MIIDIEDIENPKAERNVEIMKMVMDGKPYRAIGAHFGMTAAAISYIARQHGYAKRPQVVHIQN